jgi:hypothetical protein
MMSKLAVAYVGFIPNINTTHKTAPIKLIDQCERKVGR